MNIFQNYGTTRLGRFEIKILQAAEMPTTYKQNSKCKSYVYNVIAVPGPSNGLQDRYYLQLSEVRPASML